MSLKNRIRKRIGETDIRYGGRTVSVQVYINTDEQLEKIVERMKKAAQGPSLNMAVVAAGIVEAKDITDKMWKEVAESAEKQVGGEN